jgi:hypothetical protein
MHPDLSRVGSWYHNYIKLVPEEDIAEAFTNQSASLFSFLDSIPVEKRDYKYAPDKWTIKEVVQHLIDAERIFAYRALRFARFDRTPLNSFDENSYAENAGASKRSWERLIEEFKVVRRSSELLFNSFDAAQLESDGIASNSPNYVLAVGYTLLGHSIHHVRVTRERYL